MRPTSSCYSAPIHCRVLYDPATFAECRADRYDRQISALDSGCPKARTPRATTGCSLPARWSFRMYRLDVCSNARWLAQCRTPSWSPALKRTFAYALHETDAGVELRRSKWRIGARAKSAAAMFASLAVVKLRQDQCLLLCSLVRLRDAGDLAATRSMRRGAADGIARGRIDGEIVV